MQFHCKNCLNTLQFFQKAAEKPGVSGPKTLRNLERTDLQKLYCRMTEHCLQQFSKYAVNLPAAAILCCHYCWWRGGCVRSYRQWLGASPCPAPPCSVGRRHDRKSARSSPPHADVHWRGNTFSHAVSPHRWQKTKSSYCCTQVHIILVWYRKCFQWLKFNLLKSKEKVENSWWGQNIKKEKICRMLVYTVLFEFSIEVLINTQLTTQFPDKQ